MEADLAHHARPDDELDEMLDGGEGGGEGLLAHDRLSGGDRGLDGGGVSGRRAGHQDGVDLRMVDRQGEVGAPDLEGAVALRRLQGGGRGVDGRDGPELSVGHQLGQPVGVDLAVRAAADERNSHHPAGHELDASAASGNESGPRTGPVRGPDAVGGCGQRDAIRRMNGISILVERL